VQNIYLNKFNFIKNINYNKNIIVKFKFDTRWNWFSFNKIGTKL